MNFSPGSILIELDREARMGTLDCRSVFRNLGSVALRQRAALVFAMTLWLPLQTSMAQSNPPSEPLRVTVADSVFLALRNNRNIESAYINRDAQRFDLKVAEDKFIPDVSIDGSIDADNAGRRGPDIISRTFQAGPTVSLLIPTGAFFTFSWSNASTKVIQPRAFARQLLA